MDLACSKRTRIFYLLCIVVCIFILYSKHTTSKSSVQYIQDSLQVSSAKSSVSTFSPTQSTVDDIPELSNGYIIKDERMVVQDRDSIKHLKPESYWDADNQLLSGLVPSNVHYFWCGKRWFEFKHYLSIVSVIRAIRPDRIIFNYDEKPVMDSEFYNQWLDEIRSDYPYIKMQPMSSLDAKMCRGSDEEKLTTILRILDEDGGGIYVGDKTLLKHFSPKRRLANLEFSINQNDINSGYIILRTGVMAQWKLNHTYSNIVGQPTLFKATVQTCSPLSLLLTRLNNANCYYFDGQYKKFYPKYIWTENTELAALLRYIYYGSSEINQAKPTFDTLVPNIGHMVWLGGGSMDYVFYLSVLSLLYIAKVDTLYIHGDLTPKGKYWKEIIRTQPKVVFVRRQPIDSVYGGMIQPNYLPLMSDIIRVELMIRYGGIYTDTDAIWVKPLTYKDRGYDAVATYDWVDWSYPYPEIINFGVSYGKKDAPFWRIFRDSMRTLHNDHPGYTGVSMPYRLFERYPNLLRIDTHLSVICYKFLCHPIFDKDFHNESRNHVNTDSLHDWQNSVNAFHWTHPNPKEYINRETLLNSTGIFAEVGKRVLKAAGLL